MTRAECAQQPKLGGGNVYCVVLTRREDRTREEFLNAWLGEHRQLVEALPGLVKAYFLPVTEPSERGPDGIGLLFFRDTTDLSAALASEEAKQLRAHTATFAQSEHAVRLILSEGHI
jgi:hypothetical protein